MKNGIYVFCLLVLHIGWFSSQAVATNEVNLLQRYPTTLTEEDLTSCGRAWEFSESDVYALVSFSFRVGDVLSINTGPADLGIGRSVDGAVWGIVIPREEGILISKDLETNEAVESVWLRFHPGIINSLFPPGTVFSNGNSNLVSTMRTLADGKFRNSYHCSGNALIPPPHQMTVDVETKIDYRRFFAVDTRAGTATYFASMDRHQALTLRGRWPNFSRGPAVDIAVSGNYAYVASTALQVLDISRKDQPSLAGYYYADYPINAVAVSSDFAYLAGFGGFEVLDIRNPVAPQKVGSTAKSGQPKAVRISGFYAYVVSEMLEGAGQGLSVYDISNPAQPSRVGYLSTEAGAYGLALAGQYAYAACSGAGLQIIDISQPTAPRRVGKYQTRGEAKGVWVTENYAYVACGTAGLEIVDIQDPVQPKLAGSWNSPGIASGIAVSGDLAYLADAEAGVHVIKVSNPASAYPIGSYDTPGQANQITLSGSLGYVADDDSGLEIIDFTDPAMPNLAGAYNTAGDTWTLAVAGRYAYLGDRTMGLQVIDISNSSEPRLMGTCDLNGRCNAVAISGHYAYVAVHSRKLQIIDISDPSHPKKMSESEPGWLAMDLTATGSVVYVVGDGLKVVDVTDAIQPKVTGKLDLPGNGEGVALRGNYLYIATLWDGLQVVDVTLPETPKLVGQFNITNWWAEDIVVAGSFAYVADTFYGLRIIDISNPAAPRLAGQYKGDSGGFGVAIQGDIVYLAALPLQVIDVSDRSKPKLRGICNNWFQDVIFANNQVYAAARMLGLHIFDPYAVQPRLTSFFQPNLKAFQVNVQANQGQTVYLQRSKDLQDWQNWSVMTATGNSETITDEHIGSEPCMFYRAIASGP